MIGDITNYETQDAEFSMPEDELQTEFMRLTSASKKELTSYKNAHPPTSSEADDALDTLYKAISEKYGVNTQHKDFKSYINSIAEETKLDKAVNDAISAKVIDSLVTRTKTKIMASTAFVLDRIQTLVEQEAASTGVITPELVGVAQKNLEWIDALNKIGAGLTIKDPDKTIERAIAMDKREHPEKYVETDKQNTDLSNNLAFIKQVLASLDSKQEPSKEVKENA